MDSGAWWATVHGVAQSWTRLMQLMQLMAKSEEELKSLCGFHTQLDEGPETP